MFWTGNIDAIEIDKYLFLVLDHSGGAFDEFDRCPAHF